MSYQDFQRKVSAIARRSGVEVGFKNDTESGKFIAVFPDKTRIIARESSSKVTVLFGSGHQAMAAI